jgi:cytochrome c553
MKRWREMGFWTRLVGLLAMGALVGGLAVTLGVVPIKASSGHWEITNWFLQFAMRRSVATHSLGIDAPPLDDERLIRIGAGHYETGCRACHGAPGAPKSAVVLFSTPAPPPLGGASEQFSPAQLFFIVRHGIKFTGMPAWPASGRDDEVWPVVAFLMALPKLDAAGYQDLVHGLTDGEPTDPRVPRLIQDRCARCHGGDGLAGGGDAFPRLAAQKVPYMKDALEAYATGDRPSGIMRPLAALLSEEQMQEAADWYGAQPAGPAFDSLPASARGREIALRGIPERRIPVCAKCHGPGSAPTSEHYPKLSGQSVPYLKKQLELFVEGRRGGAEFSELMDHVGIHALQPDEIDAVTRFYAASEYDDGRLGQ